MKRSSKKIFALVAAVFAVLPPAMACSVCYGEPDSPMTRGLSWAIVVLGGIVSVVLVGVAAFFVHVNRRANAMPSGARNADEPVFPS